MSKKAEQLPNLETSLDDITKLIEQMEKGELSLEQSLEQFERGVTLVKHCQQILEKAEQKVDILIQKENKESLKPFGEDDNARDE